MFFCLKFYVSLGLIVLFTVPLCAQEKFEKESRMKEQDVPTKAVQFIDSLPIKCNVKWYLEEGLKGNSVEAKFKWHKKKYSIEFDTLGVIEDVEIEIREKKIPSGLMNSISTQLENDCLKYDIEKIQIQYQGSHNLLLKQLNSEEVISGISVSYELIVRCKSTENICLFEYVFGDTGAVTSTSKIIFKNSSHLEY